MKIYIGADHAGFELKGILKKYLFSLGHDVEDKGAFKFDETDDYPDFARPVAADVSRYSEATRGIIIGGSGQGEAMVANRFKEVRAVVFYGPKIPLTAADVNGRKSDDPYEIVKLARSHNDANILSIGARFLSEEETKRAVDIFLETSFEGGRHERRVKKIDEES